MPGAAWRASEDEFLAGERVKLRSAVREAMGEFIGDLAKPWTLFATLTFDPFAIGMAGPECEVTAERRAELAVPAVSRWCAMRRFAYFLKHASKAVGRPTVGVIALEPHMSGQPHGHGLLVTEGGVVGGDISELSRLWRESRGNGWIRLEEPHSQQDVTSYCAKYMAKDASELVFSSALARGATLGRTL
jgi:hypothetical protein